MDTATATPPLTHVRVDWEGFCRQLNGLTVEHRRKPSVRRETLSEETLIGTLRRFGYEFRDESFLEMPRLVRETLLNVANGGLSGVFPAVDFFIEAGMFDAGRAKAPKNDTSGQLSSPDFVEALNRCIADRPVIDGPDDGAE